MITDTDGASQPQTGWLLKCKDSPLFSAFIDKYSAVRKQAARILQQLKYAESALKPYADYFD